MTPTPGPWEVREGGIGVGGVRISREIFVALPRDQPGDDVAIAAEIVDPVSGQPSEANARLIAAAPALFEAVGRLIGYADQRSLLEDDRVMLAQDSPYLQRLRRAFILACAAPATPDED